MIDRYWSVGVNVALVLSTVAAILLFAGCGTSKTSEPAGQMDAAEESELAAADHSGWWCPEHGVPEDVCTRCDISLVAQFKDKGDWCQQHSRPESQCFVCNPELRQRFAAQYEAKYGTKPPAPTDP